MNRSLGRRGRRGAGRARSSRCTRTRAAATGPASPTPPRRSRARNSTRPTWPEVRAAGVPVQTGVFGAHMHVALRQRRAGDDPAGSLSRPARSGGARPAAGPSRQRAARRARSASARADRRLGALTGWVAARRTPGCRVCGLRLGARRHDLGRARGPRRCRRPRRAATEPPSVQVRGPAVAGTRRSV